jgi:hypothetical protein
MGKHQVGDLVFNPAERGLGYISKINNEENSNISIYDITWINKEGDRYQTRPYLTRTVQDFKNNLKELLKIMESESA